jgi:RNA polymerase sigma factor (sigma-70 family)
LTEEPDDSVEDLLRGCQKNDRESQARLYRVFYSYAMSICLRYADSRDEAAEILNDGFMKIFKALKKFDVRRPFKPWMRTIIVNTAINHYREKQRSPRLDDINENRPSPEEDALSGISYQEILELLAALPASYRTVFNLFVIEGYKHDEIARMLNISTGSSKSLLWKAKESLKKQLLNLFEISHV